MNGFGSISKKSTELQIMKKNMLWAFAALLAAGCGGNKPQGPIADSDSVALHDIEAVVEAVGNSCRITKDSVGQVAVGMSLAELPDRIAGLYSHKEQGASPDAVTVTFSNGDGEQFVAYDFGEGTVDVINVIGRDVHVGGPDCEFGLGAPFSRVLSLPGVEAEWAGYDNGGCWYWIWEGLWFAPSQEGLSVPLASKLYHSGQAPVASDFTGSETVGFIGTGLPF